MEERIHPATKILMNTHISPFTFKDAIAHIITNLHKVNTSWKRSQKIGASTRTLLD